QARIASSPEVPTITSSPGVPTVTSPGAATIAACLPAPPPPDVAMPRTPGLGGSHPRTRRGELTLESATVSPSNAEGDKPKVRIELASVEASASEAAAIVAAVEQFIA